MSAGSSIEQLCAHYHIAAEHHDIWGKRHVVSEQTRRALLHAMGIATDTPAAERRALAQAEAADWRRRLPPVQVVFEDADPFAVPIAVPGQRIGARFRWSILEEDGSACSGEFRPADLALSGERMLGGESWQRRELVLPAPKSLGYHRLELLDLEQAAPAAAMSLIVAPRQCYQPAAVRDGGRVWGPAIQLYAVRSARNWGIGDFTDLARAVEFAAGADAALVGLNPLHALFPHDPAHASPYSPSSRSFLNVLYIDVEAVPDFAECEAARQHLAGEAFQARLRALRACELVDYPGVAGAKMEILNLLYRHFRQQHLNAGTERAAAFERFRQQHGEALQGQALFEALQEWCHERDPDAWGWRAWPERYRRRDAPAVAAFASEHGERVGFFAYLQWQAHLQLETAARRAYELGLGVGLYLDLAVGADGGGADVWSQQHLYALDARIGAPPDDFNLQGQDWGLPPWCPVRLREAAYAPFRDMLRRNMGPAGALRIDHVMALMRLFWVPAQSTPAAGGYVHYPFRDLLGILALESRRNQCLVIGEALGTVPDEVREALARLGVLSYRLLYFEKSADAGFKAPQDYEPQALVAVSTHDLPTLAGYWQGRDLELRTQLGLFPGPELREQQMIARAEDRARLLMALEREGLLPDGMSVQPVAVPEVTPELARAVHDYLARSPARVMLVQLEDMLGQTEQINLPGTTAQHPNWCRKLTLDRELWARDARIQAFVDSLRKERGSVAEPPPEAPAPGRPAPRAVIPRATYRLQLQRGFGFDQGAELVAYLHQLGISHCYTSPCLQACPGSPHGYDIVDHGTLNAELGGAAAFERFTDALHAHQMGQILDVVPNHMHVMGSENAWWLDVLENGPASEHAGYFDINWHPLKDALRGKVLVPVLGDHYGSVLERGELKLVFDAEGGAFSILYFEHAFPIDPREYRRILAHDIGRLEERLAPDDPRLLEFQSLITAFWKLPRRTETRPARMAERIRDAAVHKAALARLYRDADIARFLDETLERFNSSDGVEVLHALLDGQAWRLAYWQVASDEINYRRFFDINELAGLCMEHPEVFAATHRLVLELIAQGKVQGLRIDHPDGLYDPGDYFRQLQARVASMQARAAPGADLAGSRAEPQAAPERPLYLLAEKILAGHERLREDWEVHGTTGYDFASAVNGLFVDSAAESRMDRIYREFADDGGGFDDIVYRSKKLIMRSAMAGELEVLAQRLSAIAECDRQTRDFTLGSLREALSEIVAWFPVYRTYVSAGGAGEEDRRYMDWAVKVAKKRSPAADTSVFDFVHQALLTDLAEGKSEDYRRQVTAFAMKFQQYTGPVAAKGLEDTAFYRFNRLISLNEVGGSPDRFGVSVAAFHHQNQERARVWPHAMLATSTHDNKRSEDVRARINVLSELPERWRSCVRRWARMNRSRKRLVDDQRAPSNRDEYLLYQTLVGAWPLEPLDEPGLAAFRDRIRHYMLKAVREAKERTSWINPDADYEQALSEFVDALLADPEKSPFLADFLPFQQALSRTGLFNSLAQTLLKLTAPGVPDIYQGNELWDFSLVDPDNRRAVDYERRRALLAELQQAQAGGGALSGLADELVRTLEDGRAKLYVTARMLQLRREYPELFRAGDYVPLASAGAHADHVCAFGRRDGDRLVVTVVPRLIFGLAGGAAPLGEAIWRDTCIEAPLASWENWLTRERVDARFVDGAWRLPAADVLRSFPVAVLLARGDRADAQ